MTGQEIFIYLKLSIIQFLLKNNFIFINKDREIIFNLSILEEKKFVENSIMIGNNGSLIICTFIPISKDFISYNILQYISDYLNFLFKNDIDFSSENFDCYLYEEENNKKDFNIFCFRNILNPKIGTIIDDEFWENQIKNQMKYIYILCDLIYTEFPKSEYFSKDSLKKEKFKAFICSYIKGCIDAIHLFEEEKEKMNFKKEKMNFNFLSKEQLEKEIDNELENFNKGQKNIVRLNMLVAELNKKTSKNDINNS